MAVLRLIQSPLRIRGYFWKKNLIYLKLFYFHKYRCFQNYYLNLEPWEYLNLFPRIKLCNNHLNKCFNQLATIFGRKITLNILGDKFFLWVRPLLPYSKGAKCLYSNTRAVKLSIEFISYILKFSKFSVLYIGSSRIVEISFGLNPSLSYIIYKFLKVSFIHSYFLYCLFIFEIFQN